LYITAVLTAVFCVIGILIGPKRVGSYATDRFFAVWALIGLINMAFLLTMQSDVVTALEVLLRYTMPFYLYFFIRAFIQNRNDFLHILQTFLYSEIFVAVVFIYEVVRGPVRTEASRGFQRYVGVFADNYNYSFFISLVLLTFTYLYLSRHQFGIKRLWLWILLGLEILFLSRVVHIATWGIFIFTFIWFLYNISVIQKRTFLLIVLLVVISYNYWGHSIKEQYLAPMTEDEVAVLQGNKPIERFGHGRMSRWSIMIPEWESASFAGKLLGLPVELDRKYIHFVSAVVHNDFLRITFLFGLMGLACFLSILFSIYKRARKIDSRDRYIAFGSIVIFCLYAVSGTPLMYSQLQYILYAIFAYVLLPEKLRKATSPIIDQQSSKI